MHPRSILSAMILLGAAALGAAGAHAQDALALSGANVFGLADAAPYSGKRHVTVRYGAVLGEATDGPIAVAATVLTPYDTTVVLGAEMIEGQTTGETLVVAFAPGAPPPERFAVLLKTADGGAAAWLHGLPADRLVAAATGNEIALSQVTPLLTAEQAAGIGVAELTAAEDGLTHSAPLGEQAHTPLAAVYLVIDRPQLEPIRIAYAGFRADDEPAEVVVVHGVGRPSGAESPTLEVTGGDASVTRVYPNADGAYVFARPAAPVFSLVFRAGVDVFYPPYGRWFTHDQALDGMVAPLSGEYENAAGEVSDLAAWQAGVKTSRLPAEYAGFSPHVRAWWTGTANRRVRFRSEYFLNNLGFHDRDVATDPDDGCLYGLYFGESDIEARQVRLFEKSNILASEAVALALQQCVRIHTIAPGHTLQSYDHIQALAERVDARLLIFAANGSTFMYLTPAFQEAYFGYVREHSPVAAFDLVDGALAFLPPSTDYILHAATPRFAFDSGAVVSAAFGLPLDHAPPEARNAWAVLGAILERYHAEFPQALLVLDTLYEPARCAAQGDCGRLPLQSAQQGSGTVSGGLPQFFDNIAPYCAMPGVLCSATSSDDALTSPLVRDLIYENDFHLNRHGNAWHARRLADAIVTRLREP